MGWLAIMACGAHGFYINDGRWNSLSFPKCKVMFHVCGKRGGCTGAQLEGGRRDREERKKGFKR